jgi:hypothetical protein
MSAMPVRRDYDGKFVVEGYEDLRFSTEDDAEQAAEMCLHYYIDRMSREIQQESRYRRAAERAKG